MLVRWPGAYRVPRPTTASFSILSTVDKSVELNRRRGGRCAQPGNASLSCTVLALSGLEVNPTQVGNGPRFEEEICHATSLPAHDRCDSAVRLCPAQRISARRLLCILKKLKISLCGIAVVQLRDTKAQMHNDNATQQAQTNFAGKSL